ncbi:MAG: radical SAM protein, partial [Minisyncoccales bacterium]
PLLVDGIANFIKYIVSKGINCTMSTNLTLLNEKMARELANAGLKKVHVSLDSFDPFVHNKIRGMDKSFERMEANLRLLKNNNIRYTMVTTLMGQSPDHYAKTIDIAYQLGASAHKTNTVVPQGRSISLTTKYDGSGEYDIKKYIKVWKNKKKQYLKKMGILAETMFSIQMGEGIITNSKIPEILKIGCPAGILTCAINESGDVTPCSFFTGLIMGNIFDNNFFDIWNSESMHIFRKRGDIAVCGKCRYRDNCGGCRARSYGQTGSVNREDSYCFMNNNCNKKMHLSKNYNF